MFSRLTGAASGAYLAASILLVCCSKLRCASPGPAPALLSSSYHFCAAAARWHSTIPALQGFGELPTRYSRRGDRAVSGVRPQRQPLDLRQVDEYSCLTCVVANLLYMWEIIDIPDTWWVDREIGRQPGRAAQRDRARRLLLEQGLSLELVCAYQPERFLREGVDYLRRYYSQDWGRSWDQYWSTPRLERHRRECVAAYELRTFGDRMQVEYRQPTLADVTDALDRGCLVWISVDNGFGEVDCHAVLVYDQRGNTFDIYSPEISRHGLRQYRRRRLDKTWLRTEGMTAVRRTTAR